MSLFSSPPAVAAQPEPKPDPAVVAQRRAVQEQTNQENKQIAENTQQRYKARTMGTEGANAFFTSGASGYGPRTMGSANI